VHWTGSSRGLFIGGGAMKATRKEIGVLGVTNKVWFPLTHLLVGDILNAFNFQYIMHHHLQLELKKM
jgi:hypothetical protein